ncbi:MAG: RNA polymerase sigma factor [Dehalococcoidia bacterium]
MGDNDEDVALVAGTLQGSQEAAEALVDRHWRELWHIARGITGDAAGAEDIVQEALTAAFNRLDRFDPQRGSVRAWLGRITVNRALNRRRDHRPAEPLPDDVAENPTDRDSDAAFLAAIAGLSDEHRAVLVLRYGLDYTPQEISETLGLRLGTVHSRLARALEGLRRSMGTARA